MKSSSPPSKQAPRAVIIGAGVGGLAAAIDLAAQGLHVTLCEAQPRVGGKMRTVEVAGRAVDSGPTVLTLRHVFDQLFADAGHELDAHVHLRQASILARHAWSDGTRLDLHADPAASRAEIGEVFGPREARAFDDFQAYCRAIYEEVQDVFIFAQRPTMLGVARSYGLSALSRVGRIDFSRSLWAAVSAHFAEPRLRQLFGRYATYTGGSPFLSPGTLNLVAHVEQAGVWYVDGGMDHLAQALAGLAVELGVELHTGCAVAEVEVEGGRARSVRLADGRRLPAEVVVANVDAGAIAAGVLGTAARAAAPPVATGNRSLSALTLSMVARPAGFDLVHHNVFFSDDYPDEFDRIFGQGRLPADPTVYLCAQDRTDGPPSAVGPERLFTIVNAPPRGDHAPLPDDEVQACIDRTLQRLATSGLSLAEPTWVATRPRDFETLFPMTGGALYGPAPHGWRTSFTRSGARSRLPGLYLAGGGVHPGAGVPMAATSGRLAASQVLEDLRWTGRSRPGATPGGTSTSSTRLAATA